jgi:hypothetical protein
VSEGTEFLVGVIIVCLTPLLVIVHYGYSNFLLLILVTIILYFGSFTLGGLLFVVFQAIYFVVFKFILKSIGLRGVLFPFMLFIGIATLTLVGVIRFSSPPPDYYVYVLVANAVLILLSYCVITVLDSYREIVSGAFARRCIPCILMQKLTDIIQITENSRGELLASAVQQQVQLLEEIARYIEHYFPQQYKCDDSTTEAWLKHSTKEAANSIREKKRWVLLPMKDTADHLNSELLHALRCILDKDWNGLRRLKSEELSRDIPQPRLIRSRVANAVKLLLIAALPLAGFIAVQLSPWQISGSTRDYVLGAVILWAIFTLISPLDPTYNAKVTTIKDFSAIIPTPKSK